jgi:hypothetical protein
VNYKLKYTESFRRVVRALKCSNNIRVISKLQASKRGHEASCVPRTQKYEGATAQNIVTCGLCVSGVRTNLTTWGCVCVNDKLTSLSLGFATRGGGAGALEYVKCSRVSAASA